MPRKPTDICLLCKINKSTKENSHIIPKFISSDFLGEKSQKKGFIIDSETGLLKIIQDSPKESFILCPQCESYFSVLESAVAQELKNLQENTEGPITEPIVLESKNIASNIFHLFYYSIFWRASISNLDIFEPFKLSTEIEEYLRSELQKYISSTRADFDQKLVSCNLGKILPYAVFTSLTFSDKTKNLIFAPGVSFPFCLIADKFGLVLYDEEKEIPKPMNWLFNTENSHTKISFLPQAVWEKVMVETPSQILAGKRKKRIEIQEKLSSLAESMSKLTSNEAKKLKEILKENHDI